MSDNNILARFLTLVEIAPPVSADLQTLQALHQAYPSIIPFENIEVLLGRPLSIEIDAIAEKMLDKRRGGYCFEHNLLFKAVLEEAGFEVTPHLARVVWGMDKPAATPQTHMLLIVNISGIRYLADVGFGGVSLTAPQRLVEGEQNGFVLERTGSQSWLMSVNAGGTRRLMYSVDERPCQQADILVASHFVATHPESIFRHHLMMAKIIDGAQVNLFDRGITTYRGEQKQEVKAESFETFCALLSPFFAGKEVLSKEDLRALFEKTAG